MWKAMKFRIKRKQQERDDRKERLQETKNGRMEKRCRKGTRRRRESQNPQKNEDTSEVEWNETK